jgi:type II secretory pathway pseudopilin PulG
MVPPPSTTQAPLLPFPQRRQAQAFSLVEVVLAIGVVSFAFVAILGLLPAGMTQFRQAVDTTVCAQIAQRVIGDAQQMDFDVLTDWQNLPMTDGQPQQNLTFRAPEYGEGKGLLRYFDDQANEIVPKSGKTLSKEEQSKVIYHVNTRITPRTALPRVSANGNTDSLGTATVTVEVAFNPGNLELKFHSGTSKRTDPQCNLIDTSKTPGVIVKTYSAQVGRNQ